MSLYPAQPHSTRLDAVDAALNVGGTSFQPGFVNNVNGLQRFRVLADGGDGYATFNFDSTSILGDLPTLSVVATPEDFYVQQAASTILLDRTRVVMGQGARSLQINASGFSISDPANFRTAINGASLAGNNFTGLQTFSGLDSVGVRLKSLTSAQYGNLTPADGDIYLDTTTHRIDARVGGTTREVIDNFGGQQILGTLGVNGALTLGVGGPLLRNSGGNIEARNNANSGYAPLVGSAIDVTTLQIAGVPVGSLINNSGFARLEAMIAARFNTSAGNSIYCTDAAASTTRVGINRGDDGTIIIVGGGSFGWSNPATDVRVNPVLLGLDRLDANTVEINNGTPGTFRDLSLRNLNASGTINAQGNQDFFNGANFTRATRTSGTNGRLTIFRPGSTVTPAVSFGTGNEELLIGPSGEGSIRVGGGVLTVGCSNSLLIDSLANNFTFRGAASTTMATLTGVGNLNLIGELQLSTDTRMQRSVQALTTQVFDTSLAAWQTTHRSEASATGARFSVLGATPIVRQSLPAAATDAATTQALANSIRSLLINFGFAN